MTSANKSRLPQAKTIRFVFTGCVPFAAGELQTLPESALSIYWPLPGLEATTGDCRRVLVELAAKLVRTHRVP
jgi:hypothetical protein